MTRPSLPSSARSTWNLRPGDLPRAAMARHPELGDLENNALFRYMAWRDRTRTGLFGDAGGVLGLTLYWLMIWIHLFHSLAGGEPFGLLPGLTVVLSLVMTAACWALVVAPSFNLRRLPAYLPPEILVGPTDNRSAAAWSWASRAGIALKWKFIVILATTMTSLAAAPLFGWRSSYAAEKYFLVTASFVAPAVAAGSFGLALLRDLPGTWLSFRIFTTYPGRLISRASRLGSGGPNGREWNFVSGDFIRAFVLMAAGAVLLILWIVNLLLWHWFLALPRRPDTHYALNAGLILSAAATGAVLGELHRRWGTRRAPAAFDAYAKEWTEVLEDYRIKYYESGRDASGRPAKITLAEDRPL